MSTAIEKLNAQEEDICALVTGGDASKLTPEQRTQYYVMRCKTAGLDPRAQPFQFMNLQGKLILYALKAASDQLSSVHGIRVEVVSQETTPDGIRVVTVRAIAKDGRQTDEIGCVSTKGKGGDELANAYMKAVTKAKRRAILSLCGLGCSDETEVETIPGASVVPVEPPKELKRPQAKPTPVAQTQRLQPAIDAQLDKADAPPSAENVNTETGEVYDDNLGEQSQDPAQIKVSAVTFAEPKKPGGKRTYFITCSDSRIYFTQVETVAQDAQIAKDQGNIVQITTDPKPTENKGKEYWRVIEMAVIQ